MKPPQTTADVVAAVEHAFAPDIRLRRLRTSAYFRPESADTRARAVFRQCCVAAYAVRAQEIEHDGRRPLYAVDAIGRKLWDEMIDDTTLDYFIRGAAGLTVEYVDENEP